MKSIEIYDPPMCCSTGVCGVDPDDQLARFASDIDWLRRQGVAVRRYNLGQEPMAFMTNAEVHRIVAESQGRDLPIVMVDGRVASKGMYLTREQLASLAEVSPSPASAPSKGDSGCCGGSGCC